MEIRHEEEPLMRMPKGAGLGVPVACRREYNGRCLQSSVTSPRLKLRSVADCDSMIRVS